MDPAALSALSPIDGRYRKGADPLRAVLSESGLIRERILDHDLVISRVRQRLGGEPRIPSRVSELRQMFLLLGDRVVTRFGDRAVARGRRTRSVGASRR